MEPRSPRAWPRWVALSRSGRFLALRANDAIELIDAIGTAPRRSIATPAVDFACVGTELWLLDAGRILRYRLDSERAVDPEIDVPASAVALDDAGAADAREAFVLGPEPVWAHAVDARIQVVPVAEPGRLWSLGGRRFAAWGGTSVRIGDVGRASTALPCSGDVLEVRPLLAGRALVVVAREGADVAFQVLRSDGKSVHRIAVKAATHWAIASDRGVGVVAAGDQLSLLDLRFGRVQSESSAALPVADLAIDADGRFVVMAGLTPDGGAPAVTHVATTDLFAGRHAPTTPEPAEATPPRGPGLRVVPAAPETDLAAIAPADRPPVTEPPPAPELSSLPPPLAFGVPLPPLVIDGEHDWPPYRSPVEHLDDLLDWVAARTARAIADAWNTGRLTAPASGERPFEREVRALLGHAAGLAADELAATDEQLARMAARNAGRVRASLAQGIRLPFIELMRELDLPPTAGHVLMVAMAPTMRGEVARLYGILANDDRRPLVDRFLIETILAGTDRTVRNEVVTALAGDAPLVRYGVLHLAASAGGPMFDAITVDPTVVERVRAPHTPRIDPIRRLDQLTIPPAILRDLLEALARPRRPEDPVRLVVRGRPGSGRRSLVAALAAEVGRTITSIDCLRLPRAGVAMAAALRAELTRALLRGSIAVISGLEVADPADGEAQDRLRDVIRTHPGPIAIRTAPEANLPIEPGHVTATLPPLSETARAQHWRAALARGGLHCGDPDILAARWRIGPGVIEHVVAQAAIRRAEGTGDDAGDDTALLHQVARQHVATRLEHVATAVRRLARWEDVALPDDLLDSIREFVGRVEHRRTVFERWGFDAKVASARGLSALFYGPPGTGKSMVAGLIARELGLDLYRIDLSRVVSKWIGETEKNLAEVFDAAEDGQVVILFDEADSLFARRTEVKTSVDRYANLEVNYILQRLDSFEGIAILTTNLEGSIDPAFKRRMSLRLYFPFPDDDMRKRLWAAHIPSETPVAGDFDFEDLARRFPMSGGYIRNSALRAAFLAAQERRPLSQAHLIRAIALEYRELNKLSASGRME